MLNSPLKAEKLNERLLQRIAFVAGAFSFIICILMIANFLQLKKADPTNMKVLTALVERLNQDPADNQLREEIRTLDLLSRKAYFTSQWQIHMGGYLLLAGIAVMIIALQWLKLRSKRVPVLSGEHEQTTFLIQKNSRRLVLIGGAILLATALVFGFLSNNQLKKRYSDASLLTITETVSNEDNKKSLTDSAINTAVPIDSASTGSSQPSDIAPGKEELSTAARNVKLNSPASTADNFPTFRGPGGFGNASQKNIPVDWDGPSGKNILWKTAIPLPGYNSPVTWDDRIFLTGASESKREVYGIDKNSGKILWTAPVANIQGSPTKVPQVTKETGFAAPTAAVNMQAVFAMFPNGDLVTLDHNGKQLWAQNLGLPQNYYGHASSLMIYNDLLIIQFDQSKGSKIFALNTATGKTVWSTGRQVKVSWSSPILVPAGNGIQIVTTADPYVAGYDAKTGSELWKLEAISGEVGPSAAFANGIVFTVNDYSKLTAIKLGSQPVQLWENNEYLSDIPSPVATDKYLFLVTSYGVVACFDTQTGNKYWEKEFNNAVFSSPVIAENRVYLMDRTGIMHIFKADKEYSSVGEPKLGERSACTPAFSNGKIFLRGDQNLYCIGK